MWVKIQKIILAHLVQSVAVVLVIIASIGGVSYFVIQSGNSSGSTKEITSDDNMKLCSEIVKIGTTTVEKDPAGDSEAWLRFDYKTSASQALNCRYTITFYDSQQQVIRTIPNVEDTFQAPSGQIHNGYSSTPYQSGMTARVSIQ